MICITHTYRNIFPGQTLKIVCVTNPASDFKSTEKKKRILKNNFTASLIILLSFSELNNGLSSTEELSLYPENGYARYSHGGLSRWTHHCFTWNHVDVEWRWVLFCCQNKKESMRETDMLVHWPFMWWEHRYQTLSVLWPTDWSLLKLLWTYVQDIFWISFRSICPHLVMHPPII